MSLKNVTRIESRYLGKANWSLIDSEGDVIIAFDVFSKSIIDEAYATKKRYCEVVSKFIDYLYEVGIVGGPGVSRKQINDAVNYYIILLRDGQNINFGYLKKGVKHYKDEDEELELSLRLISKSLGITALKPNSWSNTIAALNRFLRVCTALEVEAREIALHRGEVDPSIINQSMIDYRPLLDAVNGSTRLSRGEVKHIRQSSMLGSLIRFRGGELSRPAGLAAPKIKVTQRDTKVFDFPMDKFSLLIDTAKSWRDRALWLLTAASGIRRSEALNLEWSHIDIEQRMVYVLDPDYTRYGRDLDEDERTNRFKGRVVSWTYLRQPYKDWFFEALLEYRKREYVLPRDGNDYVFQYVVNGYRGRPLKEASDAALNNSFTNAVKRAGIDGPPMNRSYVWTQHSFRHAYGVYMLNNFQVPGLPYPGLTEAEVQLLMGHKSIISTRQYARIKEANLKRKLSLYDQAVLDNNELIDLDLLPEQFAQRLKQSVLM
jgi:integrase